MRYHSENEGAGEVVVSRVEPSWPPDEEPSAVLETPASGGKPTPGQTASQAARIERELQTLDPATKILFLAQRSGVLVGAVRLWGDSSDQSDRWLVGIVVHPQCRRAIRLSEGGSRAHLEFRSLSAREAGPNRRIRAEVTIGFPHAGPTSSCSGDGRPSP